MKINQVKLEQIHLQKKIYELTNIKYNEIEIIDSYKELILEKSV